MKKIISLFIISILIFSLSGCEISIPNFINNTTNESNQNIDDYEKDYAELIKEIERLETELEAYDNDKITYADVMESINNCSQTYIKSNVMIETTGYKMFGPVKYDGVGGQGSGVIFCESSDSQYYYCLTNNHVTYLDPQYTHVTYKITDYKDNSYSGTLLFSSSSYDLAVLKFRKSTSSSDELTVLDIKTKNPSVGDLVIAIGQPEGQNNAVTIGKITDYTNISLSDGGSSSNVTFEVIKHTAPINHGSSGGVLIDLDGNIVGINYAGSYTESGIFMHAYSIPIEKVIEYLTNNGFILK